MIHPSFILQNYIVAIVIVVIVVVVVAVVMVVVVVGTSSRWGVVGRRLVLCL